MLNILFCESRMTLHIHTCSMTFSFKFWQKMFLGSYTSKKKHPSTSRQEKHSNRTASLAILQRNNVCKRQKSQEVRAKLCQTPGMYGNFGGLKNCKPSHVWQPPLDPGLNRKDNFYEMRSKHVFTFVNLKKTVCKKKIKRPKAIWRWFWSPQYLSKLRQ